MSRINPEERSNKRINVTSRRIRFTMFAVENQLSIKSYEHVSVFLS